MNIPGINVEIWSDVTCHFCYTAKRAFEAALTHFEHATDVRVEWRSFELAPGFTTQPDRKFPQFFSELKGITLAEATGMIEHVTGLAQQAGLTYDLHRAIPANSFRAHRLSHLAKQHRLQAKAEELLHQAYFSEGKNIDDEDTLKNIGQQVGLDPLEVIRALQGTAYTTEVTEDLLEARRLGISSVPFFRFNRKTTLAGAQSPEVYLETLRKIWTEQLAESKQAQSCEVGTSCI